MNGQKHPNVGGVLEGHLTGTGEPSLDPPHFGNGPSRIPKGSATIRDVRILGGDEPNVSRVVRGMSAGFRACYSRGLINDPDQQGRIDVVLELNARGEVIKATTDLTGRLCAVVTNCIARRLQSATFPSGETDNVHVSFAIRFEILNSNDPRDDLRPPP
jgi:hypothetical protein